jgi:hypothetical protein
MLSMPATLVVYRRACERALQLATRRLQANIDEGARATPSEQSKHSLKDGLQLVDVDSKALAGWPQVVMLTPVELPSR